ncbi:MAG: NosD domain-containing protein, partial [Candidatus Omnitrophota bacterium]
MGFFEVNGGSQPAFVAGEKSNDTSFVLKGGNTENDGFNAVFDGDQQVKVSGTGANEGGVVVLPSPKSAKAVQLGATNTGSESKVTTVSLGTETDTTVVTPKDAENVKVEAGKSVSAKVQTNNGDATANGQTAAIDSKASPNNIQVKLGNNPNGEVKASINTANEVTTNVQVTNGQVETDNLKAEVKDAGTKVEAVVDLQSNQAKTDSVVRVEGIDSGVSSKNAVTEVSINKEPNIQAMKAYNENGDTQQEGVTYKRSEAAGFTRYIKMPELNGVVIPDGYRQTKEVNNGNNNVNQNNNNAQGNEIGVIVNKDEIKVDESSLDKTNDEIIPQSSLNTAPPTGPPRTSTERKPSFCCPSKDQTVSSSAATTVSSSEIISNQIESKLSDSNQTPNRAQNDYFTQPIRGPGTKEINCAAQALSSYLNISNEEAASLLKQYSKFNTSTGKYETSMYGLQQVTGTYAREMSVSDLNKLQDNAIIYVETADGIGHYVTYDAATGNIMDNGESLSMDDFTAKYNLTDDTVIKTLVGEADKTMGSEVSEDILRNTWGAESWGAEASAAASSGSFSIGSFSAGAAVSGSSSSAPAASSSSSSSDYSSSSSGDFGGGVDVLSEGIYETSNSAFNFPSSSASPAASTSAVDTSSWMPTYDTTSFGAANPVNTPTAAQVFDVNSFSMPTTGCAGGTCGGPLSSANQLDWGSPILNSWMSGPTSFSFGPTLSNSSSSSILGGSAFKSPVALGSLSPIIDPGINGNEISWSSYKNYVPGASLPSVDTALPNSAEFFNNAMTFDSRFLGVEPAHMTVLKLEAGETDFGMAVDPATRDIVITDTFAQNATYGDIVYGLGHELGALNGGNHYENLVSGVNCLVAGSGRETAVEDDESRAASCSQKITEMVENGEIHDTLERGVKEGTVSKEDAGANSAIYDLGSCVLVYAKSGEDVSVTDREFDKPVTAVVENGSNLSFGVWTSEEGSHDGVTFNDDLYVYNNGAFKCRDCNFLGENLYRLNGLDFLASDIKDSNIGVKNMFLITDRYGLSEEEQADRIGKNDIVWFNNFVRSEEDPTEVFVVGLGNIANVCLPIHYNGNENREDNLGAFQITLIGVESAGVGHNGQEGNGEGTGITLRDTTDTYVGENTIDDFTTAIALIDSNDNDITDNSISGSENGVSLTGSSDNNIEANKLAGSGDSVGIYVDDESTGNRIVNNEFSGHSGFSIIDKGRDNTVTKNEISGGQGIYTLGKSDIEGNKLTELSGEGDVGINVNGVLVGKINGNYISGKSVQGDVGINLYAGAGDGAELVGNTVDKSRSEQGDISAVNFKSGNISGKVVIEGNIVTNSVSEKGEVEAVNFDKGVTFRGLDSLTIKENAVEDSKAVEGSIYAVNLNGADIEGKTVVIEGNQVMNSASGRGDIIAVNAENAIIKGTEAVSIKDNSVNDNDALEGNVYAVNLKDADIEGKIVTIEGNKVSDSVSGQGDIMAVNAAGAKIDAVEAVSIKDNTIDGSTTLAGNVKAVDVNAAQINGKSIVIEGNKVGNSFSGNGDIIGVDGKNAELNGVETVIIQGNTVEASGTEKGNVMGVDLTGVDLDGKTVIIENNKVIDSATLSGTIMGLNAEKATIAGDTVVIKDNTVSGSATQEGNIMGANLASSQISGKTVTIEANKVTDSYSVKGNIMGMNAEGAKIEGTELVAIQGNTVENSATAAGNIYGANLNSAEVKGQTITIEGNRVINSLSGKGDIMGLNAEKATIAGDTVVIKDNTVSGSATQEGNIMGANLSSSQISGKTVTIEANKVTDSYSVKGSIMAVNAENSKFTGIESVIIKDNSIANKVATENTIAVNEKGAEIIGKVVSITNNSVSNDAVSNSNVSQSPDAAVTMVKDGGNAGNVNYPETGKLTGSQTSVASPETEKSSLGVQQQSTGAKIEGTTGNTADSGDVFKAMGAVEQEKTSESSPSAVPAEKSSGVPAEKTTQVSGETGTDTVQTEGDINIELMNALQESASKNLDILMAQIAKAGEIESPSSTDPPSAGQENPLSADKNIDADKLAKASDGQSGSAVPEAGTQALPAETENGNSNAIIDNNQGSGNNGAKASVSKDVKSIDTNLALLSKQSDINLLDSVLTDNTMAQGPPAEETGESSSSAEQSTVTPSSSTGQTNLKDNKAENQEETKTIYNVENAKYIYDQGVAADKAGQSDLNNFGGFNSAFFNSQDNLAGKSSTGSHYYDTGDSELSGWGKDTSDFMQTGYSLRGADYFANAEYNSAGADPRDSDFADAIFTEDLKTDADGNTYMVHSEDFVKWSPVQNDPFMNSRETVTYTTPQDAREYYAAHGVWGGLSSSQSSSTTVTGSDISVAGVGSKGAASSQEAGPSFDQKQGPVSTSSPRNGGTASSSDMISVDESSQGGTLLSDVPPSEEGAAQIPANAGEQNVETGAENQEVITWLNSLNSQLTTFFSQMSSSISAAVAKMEESISSASETSSPAGQSPSSAETTGEQPAIQTQEKSSSSPTSPSTGDPLSGQTGSTKLSADNPVTGQSSQQKSTETTGVAGAAVQPGTALGATSRGAEIKYEGGINNAVYMTSGAVAAVSFDGLPSSQVKSDVDNGKILSLTETEQSFVGEANQWYYTPYFGSEFEYPVAKLQTNDPDFHVGLYDHDNDGTPTYFIKDDSSLLTDREFIATSMTHETVDYQAKQENIKNGMTVEDAFAQAHQTALNEQQLFTSWMNYQAALEPYEPQGATGRETIRDIADSTGTIVPEKLEAALENRGYKGDLQYFIQDSSRSAADFPVGSIVPLENNGQTYLNNVIETGANKTTGEHSVLLISGESLNILTDQGARDFQGWAITDIKAVPEYNTGLYDANGKTVSGVPASGQIEIPNANGKGTTLIKYEYVAQENTVNWNGKGSIPASEIKGSEALAAQGYLSSIAQITPKEVAAQADSRMPSAGKNLFTLNGKEVDPQEFARVSREYNFETPYSSLSVEAIQEYYKNEGFNQDKVASLSMAQGQATAKLGGRQSEGEVQMYYQPSLKAQSAQPTEYSYEVKYYTLKTEVIERAPALEVPQNAQFGETGSFQGLVSASSKDGVDVTTSIKNIEVTTYAGDDNKLVSNQVYSNPTPQDMDNLKTSLTQQADQDQGDFKIGGWGYDYMSRCENKIISVEFAAADERGLETTQVAYYHITNENRAPVLSVPGEMTVYAGDTVEFTLNAVDADKDALTITMGNLPTGAEFKDNGDGTAAFKLATVNNAGTNDGISYVLPVVSKENVCCGPAAQDSKDVRINVIERPAGSRSTTSGGGDSSGSSKQVAVHVTDEQGGTVMFSTVDKKTDSRGNLLVDRGNLPTGDVNAKDTKTGESYSIQSGTSEQRAKAASERSGDNAKALAMHDEKYALSYTGLSLEESAAYASVLIPYAEAPQGAWATLFTTAGTNVESYLGTEEGYDFDFEVKLVDPDNVPQAELDKIDVAKFDTLRVETEEGEDVILVNSNIFDGMDVFYTEITGEVTPIVDYDLALEMAELRTLHETVEKGLVSEGVEGAHLAAQEEEIKFGAWKVDGKQYATAEEALDAMAITMRGSAEFQSTMTMEYNSRLDATGLSLKALTPVLEDMALNAQAPEQLRVYSFYALTTAYHSRNADIDGDDTVKDAMDVIMEDADFMGLCDRLMTPAGGQTAEGWASEHFWRNSTDYTDLMLGEIMYNNYNNAHDIHTDDDRLSVLAVVSTADDIKAGAYFDDSMVDFVSQGYKISASMISSENDLYSVLNQAKDNPVDSLVLIMHGFPHQMIVGNNYKTEQTTTATGIHESMSYDTDQNQLTEEDKSEMSGNDFSGVLKDKGTVFLISCLTGYKPGDEALCDDCEYFTSNDLTGYAYTNMADMLADVFQAPVIAPEDAVTGSVGIIFDADKRAVDAEYQGQRTDEVANQTVWYDVKSYIAAPGKSIGGASVVSNTKTSESPLEQKVGANVNNDCAVKVLSNILGVDEAALKQETGWNKDTGVTIESMMEAASAHSKPLTYVEFPDVKAMENVPAGSVVFLKDPDSTLWHAVELTETAAGTSGNCRSGDCSKEQTIANDWAGAVLVPHENFDVSVLNPTREILLTVEQEDSMFYGKSSSYVFEDIRVGRNNKEYSYNVISRDPATGDTFENNGKRSYSTDEQLNQILINGVTNVNAGIRSVSANEAANVKGSASAPGDYSCGVTVVYDYLHSLDSSVKIEDVAAYFEANNYVDDTGSSTMQDLMDALTGYDVTNSGVYLNDKTDVSKDMIVNLDMNGDAGGGEHWVYVTQRFGGDGNEFVTYEDSLIRDIGLTVPLAQFEELMTGYAVSLGVPSSGRIVDTNEAEAVFGRESWGAMASAAASSGGFSTGSFSCGSAVDDDGGGYAGDGYVSSGETGWGGSYGESYSGGGVDILSEGIWETGDSAFSFPSSNISDYSSSSGSSSGSNVDILSEGIWETGDSAFSFPSSNTSDYSSAAAMHDSRDGFADRSYYGITQIPDVAELKSNSVKLEQYADKKGLSSNYADWSNQAISSAVEWNLKQDRLGAAVKPDDNSRSGALETVPLENVKVWNPETKTSEPWASYTGSLSLGTLDHASLEPSSFGKELLAGKSDSALDRFAAIPIENANIAGYDASIFKADLSGWSAGKNSNFGVIETIPLENIKTWNAQDGSAIIRPDVDVNIYTLKDNQPDFGATYVDGQLYVTDKTFNNIVDNSKNASSPEFGFKAPLEAMFVHDLTDGTFTHAQNQQAERNYLIEQSLSYKGVVERAGNAGDAYSLGAAVEYFKSASTAFSNEPETAKNLSVVAQSLELFGLSG